MFAFAIFGFGREHKVPNFRFKNLRITLCGFIISKKHYFFIYRQKRMLLSCRKNKYVSGRGFTISIFIKIDRNYLTTLRIEVQTKIYLGYRKLPGCCNAQTLATFEQNWNHFSLCREITQRKVSVRLEGK